MKVYKRSVGDHVFDTLNILFITLFALSCLYPFLYIFNVSVSEGISTSQYGINIIPHGVTFKYYTRIFKTDTIITGFANSIFRTVVGTILCVIFTSMGAYPLSKKHLPNRNFWTWYILFTMFFSGGLIPFYFLIRDIGLINTRWALIIPSLISTFSLLIMRNFMMSLPPELEESAKMDGANDIHILVRIILPLCKPIMATVALWSAVSHWNAWFDCLIYCSKPNLVVLQVVLYRIINFGSSDAVTGNMLEDFTYPEVIKACTIMVTTLPIICVYPFAQKYFIRGILIGSLKG